MSKLLDRFLSYDEIVALLKEGESILQNENGFNPLHAAVLVTVDSKRRIKYVVEAGANVNEKDRNTPFQNTPLHILIVNENITNSLYLLELAAHKIDFSVVDSQRKTTLILAAKTNLTEVGLELVRQINGNKAIVDMQDIDGMTALHYACLYGNKQLAETLIQQGASLALKNNEGKTALDCTALGERKIIETLNSVEINPERDEKAARNSFSDRNNQPIMPINPETLKPSVLEILMAKINVAQLTDYLNGHLLDSTALVRSQMAVLSDEGKEFIRQQGALLTGVPLRKSLADAATALKIYLIENGYYSDWLLRIESSNGNDELVGKMLQNCKEMIDQYGLPSQRTALHQAAIKGHISTCRLLINAGANINCLDNQLETPLLFAIKNQFFDLAKELVSLGADISLANKAGDNSLDMLTKMKQLHLIHELTQLRRQFEQNGIEELTSLSSTNQSLL